MQRRDGAGWEDREIGEKTETEKPDERSRMIGEPCNVDSSPVVLESGPRPQYFVNTAIYCNTHVFVIKGRFVTRAICEVHSSLLLLHNNIIIRNFSVTFTNASNLRCTARSKNHLQF